MIIHRLTKEEIRNEKKFFKGVIVRIRNNGGSLFRERNRSPVGWKGGVKSGNARKSCRDNRLHSRHKKKTAYRRRRYVECFDVIRRTCAYDHDGKGGYKL